ncbi:MAG: protein-disulfide reductase DsbD N-terminal domain-containing protein [Pyrinomonadaceae bacterium]|nr:protein-disulfide reductase DsbD N-terminal domain-containing protein [Pyrinomonadaceae bacterium]
MKKTLFSIFTALIFLAGGIYQTNAQDISGSIGAVKRGGSIRGTIVMSIPSGLHVNSSRPNSQYAIPTSVKVSAVGAKVGSVSYPRGKNRKFGFSEDTLNVYEGRSAFSFNLTVPANFKGNVVKVRAVVRYQACTDEVCYPPKTKEITLTAQVR